MENGVSLSVSGLTCEYPDSTRALDSVSFALSPGEKVALIGANGAGKTSLMLSIVGVLPASSGVIKAGEETLGKKNLAKIRSAVGLVFQNPDDQLFMPTILDDVSFGPRSLGSPEEETALISSQVMETLGISRLASRSPLKLSGGEKRLCAIAAVLAGRPGVLLFDEPTAFLDPKARRDLAAMLTGLPQTMLIATHDLDFAGMTCSRVLLLKEGRLVSDTDTGILRDDAALTDAGL